MAVRLLHLKDEALIDLNEGMSSMKGNIRIAASSVPINLSSQKWLKPLEKNMKK